MALDSNAFTTAQRGTIKHFTPYPSYQSAGVNIFSQVWLESENAYVFPVRLIVAPLLNYIWGLNKRYCITLIIEDLYPRPSWWPMIQQYIVNKVLIARKGEKGAILYPTKHGFLPDHLGLKLDIWACRLIF